MSRASSVLNGYINTAEPGFEFQPFGSLVCYYFATEKPIEISAHTVVCDYEMISDLMSATGNETHKITLSNKR